MFQTLRRLLPDAKAWRLSIGTRIRQFFEGLAEEPGEICDYADNVFLDAFSGSTRHLSAWENQFGHITIGQTEAARRLDLAASWAATGGQDPSYIRNQLHTAGFDVYIHAWHESGPNPWVARNPLDYAEQPLIGVYQCEEDPGYEEPPQQWEAFDGPGAPHCTAFLANDPRYLVNDDLTTRAPPPIPTDPSRWPFFIYVGGETFPEYAAVEGSRRAEFERLLLKLMPTQQWIVVLVDYFDPEGALLTEGGEILLTEGGETLYVE